MLSTSHIEDLIVWPDSTICYRSKLSDFTHKSDDYRVIPYPVGVYNNEAQQNYYMYFWSYHEDCMFEPQNFDPEYQMEILT